MDGWMCPTSALLVIILLWALSFILVTNKMFNFQFTIQRPSLQQKACYDDIYYSSGVVKWGSLVTNILPAIDSS